MTTRIVISGSASCGKTSLIDELRKRGCRVLEEVAREVHEDRMDIPFTPEDNLKRVAMICKRQLKRENYDFGNHIVFLDRGMVDCYVYGHMIFNSLPEEYMPLKFDYKNRYSHVFLLDILPLEKDKIRIEKNDLEVKKNHEEMIKGYKFFGYEPIIVPILSENERADFIINQIHDKNGLY